ncbi:MAG: polysulfide reductase NrfD [Thermodesulfovibrionales bacterium]|nr:polysulfide reductase NrfD [Thermodesulfovibrionales bacterium]
MNASDNNTINGSGGSDFRSWFMDRLLIGMTWPEYAKSLITPFNFLVAVILCFAVPVFGSRYLYGLAAVTHASHDYPWGILLGWGLFGGVPLSGAGFVVATGYYVFGFKGLKPIVRLAVLSGLLGYFFAASYLMIDLGRPWRIYYPMIMGFGTTSLLFLVAWHVTVYLTVQLIEFSSTILEWLKSRRVHRWAMLITVAMTIAGIILSTLHQSSLGGMFLLAPGRLHPLWYSSYIPVFFLASSIYAAMAMTIFVSTMAARYMTNRCDKNFLGSLDYVTLALGKGCAVAMYVYFFLKVVGVAHDNHWDLLGTPYGQWFLVELFGFVMFPALIFTYGIKKSSPFVIRVGAVFAIAGILLNRINIAVVAFNWEMPGHMHHIIPPWQEVYIVVTMVTLHIMLFRWIFNRMPVLYEMPEYKDMH